MTILAYTGVSNPIRIYRVGENDRVISGSTTYNYDFTISENGVVMAILATVLAKTIDVVGGNIYFKVIRNGETIASGGTAPATWEANFGDAGVMFYETINILSGAEIQSGDSFRLQVESSSLNTSLTYDASFVLIQKVAPKVYEAF